MRYNVGFLLKMMSYLLTGNNVHQMITQYFNQRNIATVLKNNVNHAENLFQKTNL